MKRIVTIRWWVMMTLRPPLTQAAAFGWACPNAMTVNDNSFWFGGE